MGYAISVPRDAPEKDMEHQKTVCMSMRQAKQERKLTKSQLLTLDKFWI